MNFKNWLIEATAEDFYNLANLQRELPERAMLKVQWATGGSVMNKVVENVGDLIHRMTEKPAFYQSGYEFVKAKVESSLMYLTNGYGFEREFEENIVNNAKYKNTTPEELRQKVYKALDNYANEYEKLPTYNRAQRLAKLAAVSLGRRKFDVTISALRMLQRHLTSKEV